MDGAKEYKRMADGLRHSWSRPGIYESILGVIFLPLLFTLVLSVPAFLMGLSIGILYFALLIIFILYFIGAALYRPSFPMQVSEEMVARPAKRALISITGQNGGPRPYDNKPGLVKILPFKVNSKAYIHAKSNRNVLITGFSGQGKSKLTRHLLREMEYQKVIFSFKSNEEYLKAGYSIVDISKALPSPFADREATINAFAVTFPMSSVGIQASMIPTVLGAVLKKSNNDWDYLMNTIRKEIKGTHDQNKRSALLFIEANFKRLRYNTGEFEIGKDTLVLDFCRLNDDAKTFYAELVLRQLYHDMEKQRRKDLLVCVDEAHRLTTGEFGRYHTILVEMSREIRDKGMLWVTTQNYTDIPDALRNQFATQFLFKTISKGDLDALRSIEPLLSWTASALPNHYFVDAQFPNVHAFIPAYYYNPEGEIDIAPEKVMEGMATREEREEKLEDTIDYAQEVRDILTEKPAYATQMGKSIAQAYGIEKDKAKLGVKQALDNMRRSAEIDSMQQKKDGVNVVMYYMKDPNESPVHKQFEREIASMLNKKGIIIEKISKSGRRSMADIETRDFNIEIETGLKHSRKDLEERLAASKKRTYVIVPNDNVKERYDEIKGKLVQILTLDDFERRMEK